MRIKHCKGIIEYGMNYIERTIWIEDEKFVVSIKGKKYEVVHFDNDLWFIKD